ncbi:MAG TPA: nitrilase-related carbon-nitrogen hydrolase [bacterium]|nr:nitrilase-related carbon-nitrogen hydrolase [bacterium]
MRAAVVQSDCFLGDISRNVATHVRFIRDAAEAGATLVVFPELSLSGYLLEDRVKDIALTARQVAALFEDAGLPDIVVGVGFPERTRGAIYNAYALIRCGAKKADIIGVQRKVNLPTYGMFDEARHFRAGSSLCAYELPGGATAAVLICEDAWHPGLTVALAQLPDGMPHLIIVPAASPSRGYRGKRPSNLEGWDHAAEHFARVYGASTLTAQRVGVEDSLIFAGGSTATDHNGSITRAALFTEETIIVDIDIEALSRLRAKAPVVSARDRDILRSLFA